MVGLNFKIDIGLNFLQINIQYVDMVGLNFLQIYTGCPKKTPPFCWNRLKNGGVFLGHPVLFYLLITSTFKLSGTIDKEM